MGKVDRLNRRSDWKVSIVINYLILFKSIFIFFFFFFSFNYVI